MSEQIRNSRRRRRTINIQITFTAWVLEFIAGNAIIAMEFWGGGRFKMLYKLFDIIVMFVIIPFTYILNRDVTKEMVLLNNWHIGIKSIFVRGNTVAPM